MKSMQVGDRFGRLVLIEGDAPPGKSRFRCDCGIVVEKFRGDVKGHTKRCALDCKLGPLTAEEGGKRKLRASGGSRKAGPEKASKHASAGSNGAAPAEPQAAIATRNGIDIERFAGRLDALMRLALDVEIEHVEQMIEEIERREAALPDGDWGKLGELRADLEAGRRKATAFLDYRRAIS